MILAMLDNSKPFTDRKAIPFVAAFLLFGIQLSFYGGSEPIVK
jgi:hypothetical protein